MWLWINGFAVMEIYKIFRNRLHLLQILIILSITKSIFFQIVSKSLPCLDSHVTTSVVYKKWNKLQFFFPCSFWKFEKLMLKPWYKCITQVLSIVSPYVLPYFGQGTTPLIWKTVHCLKWPTNWPSSWLPHKPGRGNQPGHRRWIETDDSTTELCL